MVEQLCSPPVRSDLVLVSVPNVATGMKCCPSKGTVAPASESILLFGDAAVPVQPDA